MYETPYVTLIKDVPGGMALLLEGGSLEVKIIRGRPVISAPWPVGLHGRVTASELL